MKIKTTFSLIGITATMAIGALVGLNVHQNSEVKEAKADSLASDGYVFVDISSVSSYETVYCHNWGTSQTTWPGTEMTKLYGNIYYCKLKDPRNNMVIFNNGAGTQTGDLTFNATSIGRLYNLSSNTWDAQTKERMDLVIDSNTLEPNSNTTRLFVHHDNCGNWTSANAETAFRVWGTSTFASAIDGVIYRNLHWFQNSGTGASGLWYGYADIPSDITGWQTVRLSNNNKRQIWNFGPSGNVTGSFSSRIWKMKENNWDWSWDSATGDTAVGAELFGTILAAYDTCSSSVLNGYGAADSLNSNFYSHATASAKSSTVTTLGGSSATVQEHMDAMIARKTSGLGKSNIFPIINNNNATSTIVVVTSLISVCALGAFFFLKKKKENN